MDITKVYQSHFERSPVAGIIADAGKIALANKKAKEMFGYRDMEGLSIAGILPGSGLGNLDLKGIRADGSIFLAEVQSAELEFDGKHLISHTITDISQNRKLLADLSERVKEQTTLLKIAEILFTARSPKTMFSQSIPIIVNGFQFPKLIQICIALGNGQKFCTDDFRQTPDKLTSPILLSGLSYGEITVCYQAQTRPKTIGAPLFLPEEKNMLDALSKLFGLFLNHWDTLQKLRESNALITKVTALSPVNTYQFELDEQGNISFLFVSRGLSFRHVGFSADEIRDDPEKILGLIHPDDRKRFQQSLKIAAQTHEDINVQYRVVFDGIESWHWLRANSEKIGDKVVWYGSTQDITKMIDYIAVLEDILFDISHVMRKPVSTMLGLTDYLTVNENMSEHTLKDFATHIQTVAHEMDAYLRKLNEAYHRKRLHLTTNEAAYDQLLNISKGFGRKPKRP